MKWEVDAERKERGNAMWCGQMGWDVRFCTCIISTQQCMYEKDPLRSDKYL